MLYRYMLKAGGSARVVIKNTFLSNSDNASVSLRKLLLRGTGIEVNKVAVYYARFGCFAPIDLDDRIVGGDKFLCRC
jgi:hypothetical protein